jgi:hypothetical protein
MLRTGDMDARSESVDDANIRRGIRRWNRENGCASLGGEEGKSPKVNKLLKTITIAREFIHFPSEIIWFTPVLFLWCSNRTFSRARTAGKFPEKTYDPFPSRLKNTLWLALITASDIF